MTDINAANTQNFIESKLVSLPQLDKQTTVIVSTLFIIPMKGCLRNDKQKR